jgi:hypothetical protein
VTAFPELPLADLRSAQQFHRVLMLHVPRLKCRAEPVGFHQFLLGQALSLRAPDGRRDLECAECGQRFPCRTVLPVALLTRLPVPWTPASLGLALSTANLWPSRGTDHDLVEDGRLEFGDRAQVDPWYQADRNPRTGAGLSAPTSGADFRRPAALVTIKTCASS